MPFTLAHPAAVLPLLRGPLVPAALVAGSVAPDLPYLLRAGGIPVGAQSWYEPFMNATTTHTPDGAATVGLPLAAALYLGYLVARPAAAALLAGALLAGTDRPDDEAGTSPGRASGLAWLVASLALGLATHLVWDSFTHGDGAVVSRVAALRAHIGGGDLTWARLLQHVSTVLGLVVLTVHGWRRRSTVLGHVDRPARRRLVRTAAVGVAAGAVGAALATRWWWASGEGPSTAALVEGVVSDAAKGALAALLVVAAAAVVVWWALRAAGALRG